MYYYRSEKRYNIFEYETKSAVEIDRLATQEEDGAFRIYRVRALLAIKDFSPHHTDSEIQ
jgi:hypothetical protein